MFHAILSAQKKFYPKFCPPKFFLQWAVGEARCHTMLPSILVFKYISMTWPAFIDIPLHRRGIPVLSKWAQGGSQRTVAKPKSSNLEKKKAKCKNCHVMMHFSEELWQIKRIDIHPEWESTPTIFLPKKRSQSSKATCMASLNACPVWKAYIFLLRKKLMSWKDLGGRNFKILQ